MNYNKIVKGKFVKRNNRFVGVVIIDGCKEEETVHIKNTGRCKELLVEGATVFLEFSDNPKRKTRYSLVSVYKKTDNNEILINMDSQVPNEVVFEGIKNNKIQEFLGVEFLKREVKYNNSRFDIYFERENKKGFIEIKGVTLEEKGFCMFPDAPTTRGAKHIRELVDAVKEGYECWIFFLIQIENVISFSINKERDLDFYNAVKYGIENGVNVVVYNSLVREDGIEVLKAIDYDI